MSETTSDTVFQLENVAFSRGERQIFDSINLKIKKGDITAIMGPSGTGKTTVLRLMAGLIQPDNGCIIYNGNNLAKLSKAKLKEMHCNVSLLFQNSGLFTGMTVFENVAYPILEHADISKEMLRDLVLMKLEAVGLRGAKDFYPRELSGGMVRRVALARAIALDPHVILYDEPFTGQDPITMGLLMKLIRLLNDALNMTSVIVSHDVNEIMSIADYSYIIANGKIIAEGSSVELNHDQNSNVKQFIQGLPDGPVSFHHPAKSYIDELMEGV